jgi:hypothetical protein
MSTIHLCSLLNCPANAGRSVQIGLRSGATARRSQGHANCFGASEQDTIHFDQPLNGKIVLRAIGDSLSQGSASRFISAFISCVNVTAQVKCCMRLCGKRLYVIPLTQRGPAQCAYAPDFWRVVIKLSEH